MTDAPVSGPRPSDRFIPWYIVCFFALQFILFGWFYYVASSTYNGVITDQAYEKGLKYNDVIARAAAQEKLGWRLTMAKVDSALRVTLRDRADAPLSQARVMVWLVRPVQAGMDFSVDLKETAPGVYAAPVIVPAPGLWEVRASVRQGSHTYQAAQRMEF